MWSDLAGQTNSARGQQSDNIALDSFIHQNLYKCQKALGTSEQWFKPRYKQGSQAGKSLKKAYTEIREITSEIRNLIMKSEIFFEIRNLILKSEIKDKSL